MKIVNSSTVESIQDVCGTIKELYSSANLSLSLATITGKSTPHMHRKMEEVYFVIKGKAVIFVGNQSAEIKAGDLVAIPKNKYHYVETEKGESVEILVATHPGFDPSDVIEKS